MDNPNITMEEYIRLQEEKALSRGERFNWQTATYGKMEYCEDEDDYFTNFETKFPAIVLDNTLTSDAAISCGPTVSPLNDNEIDFRISFDESDDEDYMVVYDENSFSYKIISVNNLKTDSENDNDKVNMPSSPESEVSYSNDLDFFKDFENEFPAIVYNDALTSKSDFLTEHIVSPQHIDEFNNETSLFECDEKEQNVLYFNDLFPFNVIYPDDLKSDTGNDNDKIDIEQPLGDMSVIPLPNVINVDTQGSNKLLETSNNMAYPGDLLNDNDNIGGVFINLEISKCWSLEISRRLFNTLFAQELNLENHPKCGSVKNHKKTVKNGQARTRESEEYKAEARKVKPQSKSAKKNQKLRVRDNSPYLQDSCLGLRMMHRLSLKNDMPLRDKTIIALINKPVFY
ncbi:hypothetical protein Tco_0405483 [Tanacetum coccineum]